MLNHIFKKIIIVVAIVFSTTAFYLSQSHFGVITIDNSYVSGQIIKIKAPLSGVIESVNIQIGDRLEHKDVIFVYDQVASYYQLEKSREKFQQSIRNEYRECLEESMRLGKIQLKMLEYEYQHKQLARGEKLKKMKFLAESTYDDMLFQYDSSSVSKDISHLESLILEYANPEPILQRPQVKLSQLSFEEELHNQLLTRVEAPTQGYVYELFAYPNQFVEKGEVIAVLVSTDQMRIEANVLESEVGKLKPNMRVDIMSDLYKDKTLKGHIHSIVPSTAASFSPIPRNNMDSNWIKVSQRVPVLIEIDDEDKALLPIGSSSKLHVYLDEYVQTNEQEAKADSIHATKEQDTGILVQNIIADETKLAGLSANQQRCKL